MGATHVQRLELRRLVFLAVLVLFGGTGSAVQAGPAGAASVAAQVQPAAVLLAEGFSLGKLFSGMNSRTRIVQICVVVLCIGLFIMMRKFHGQ